MEDYTYRCLSQTPSKHRSALIDVAKLGVFIYITKKFCNKHLLFIIFYHFPLSFCMY